MKVRIQFTVDVDVAAWALTYGGPPEHTTWWVQRDVQRHAERMIRSHFEANNLLKEQL